ncbi:MAG: transposase [Phycisphaerales bacterium]|nr:transposase [Phycisphaerales bacterium]
MSKTTSTFSPEVRERAVQIVREHRGEYPSRWAAITSIAGKIGCASWTLSGWVKNAEINDRAVAGIPSEVIERLKALERENHELRQANEILRKASIYFAQPLGECMQSPVGQRAELDRPLKR